MLRSSLGVFCLWGSLLPTGCSDPVTNLITQVNDPDVTTRRAAVKALADVTGERAVNALANACDDPDATVRRFSLDSLAAHGPDATAQMPAILTALDDPNLAVRIAAALAVRSIDPTSDAFVPVLERELLAGEGGVFLAVGEMGPQGAWAVPALTRLLNHRESQIRALAARTLGQIGPAASEALPALERVARDSEQVIRERVQQAIDQSAR